MDWIGTISKSLPFLDQYPVWVRALSVAWLVITASFVGVLVMAPRPAITAPAPQIPTGDRVIDDAEKRIALLKKKEPVDEAKLAEALAPLFSRAAFYGIREESWNYFLFTLCKTRLILEENIGHFKSNPTTRAQLGKVVQLMVKLQNDVASIYGPNFSVTRHIGQYIYSREEFTKNLPPVLSAPNYKFFDQRDITIREIRGILQPIGLTSF